MFKMNKMGCVSPHVLTPIFNTQILRLIQISFSQSM